MIKYLATCLTVFLLLSSHTAQSKNISLNQEKMPDPRKVFTWTQEERLQGFKNVEKIVSVHEVLAGKEPRELKTASSQAMLQLASDLDALSEQLINNGNVVGLLLIHEGQIIQERYALGFKASDRWTSFSVAKSISGTLVGAAVKDGLLNLDDQVIKYLPELKGSAYDGVKIRHLLNMSSGVQWNETYTDPTSDTARLAMGLGVEDPLAALASLPRASKPGKSFSYKTGESNLLALIVMKAVKKPLAQYLSEKIWQPCGMEASAFWALDAKNRELGGCCLSMTLRDYARFGLFILDELKSDNSAASSKVLPQAWFKEATKPTLGHNYGYQWHLLNEDIFFASGIYGQMVAIDGPTNSVAVILSAWESPLSQKDDESRLNYLIKARNYIVRSR